MQSARNYYNMAYGLRYLKKVFQRNTNYSMRKQLLEE